MSWWIRTEPLSIERISIEIANLAPHLVGTVLVQLSDLHYDGLRISENLLQEVIEVTNKENPHLILLTGDYITNDLAPIRPLAEKLKHLQSRHGIYASLGNHDIYRRHGRRFITQTLNDVDIKVLWNEVAYPLGPDLAIAGLPDFWSTEFNRGGILQNISPGTPRVVLSHNPDSAEVLGQWRVDLQLSGHTHGGQVVIPFMGPAPLVIEYLRDNLPTSVHRYIPFMKECARVVKHWEWSQGWHQVGRNQLYVNRGLGTYFPGRFACPPELTIIHLTAR